jgi:hypothetical protein
MTSDDLADEVEAAIRRCRSRVLGVGDEQYSDGDTQKFENMPILELIDWTLEELDDVIVYAVMLGIRFQRFRDKWAEPVD